MNVAVRLVLAAAMTNTDGVRSLSPLEPLIVARRPTIREREASKRLSAQGT